MPAEDLRVFTVKYNIQEARGREFGDGVEKLEQFGLDDSRIIGPRRALRWM